MKGRDKARDDKFFNWKHDHGIAILCFVQLGA